jgi:hypothetical protein
MARASDGALRIVLGLGGVFTVYAGLNKALGGMRTLGWQGESPYLAVTNEHAFLIQDSHVRFLAGVYSGLGLIFLLAAADPTRFRGALRTACVLIFLGGLARLSQLRFDVTFGPDIVGSMIAEIVLMPILWWWSSRLPASSATEH